MTKPIVSEKLCRGCKAIKPASEFNKLRRGKDGLNPRCRKCVSENTKKYRSLPHVQGLKRKWYGNFRSKHLESRQKEDREYKASARGLAAARKRYHRDPEKHREKNRNYRNSEKGRAARRAYQRAVYADPEKHRLIRGRRFRRKFGITLDEYERILKSQAGKCAICRSLPSRAWLSIDHRHSDGQIRGLLCVRCNFAVGYLRDSPEIATRAAAYLREHAQLRLVV